MAPPERGAVARGPGRGALILCFDTSFLAPLLLEESTSAKVERFVARLPVSAGIRRPGYGR